MKRSYISSFFTIVMCLGCLVSYAQVTADKSVVANWGNTMSGGTITSDYTLGQAVINHATPGTLDVYEGFHPTDYGTTRVITNKKDILTIIAYPNPVSGTLHIAIAQDIAAPVTIQVNDMAGNVIKNAVIIPAALNINTDLDFSTFPQGMYIIIVNAKEQNRQVMRIIKY